MSTNKDNEVTVQGFDSNGHALFIQKQVSYHHGGGEVSQSEFYSKAFNNVPTYYTEKQFNELGALVNEIKHILKINHP